jgi:hypothetical protein
MAPLNDQIEDDFANRLRAASKAREDNRLRMQTAGLTSILSLFLLLLAFFILLNSLAQFEANRTRAVLGSLAATFNLSNPNGQSRTLGSFVGHLDAAADLEREITGLLRTLVGFGSFELIRTGTLLSVSIDNKVLFTAEGAASDKFNELAQPAAELLSLAADDVTIELTAYARPGGGKIIGARSAAIEGAAKRASAIVRAFAKFGVTPGQLVVALEDGDPRQTRIEFRVLAKPPVAAESP